MGCYNCGSSDGTDTKLCPRCADSRARRRGSAYVEQRHSYAPESKFPQYLIGSVMAVCITAFIGFNLYKDAQFKALPIHEKFYQKCLSYHQRLADKAVRDRKTSIKNVKKCIKKNGTANVPNEALQWLNEEDGGSAMLKDEILRQGQSYCSETRGRCAADPTVCQCPHLKARFGY